MSRVIAIDHSDPDDPVELTTESLRWSASNRNGWELYRPEEDVWVDLLPNEIDMIELPDGRSLSDVDPWEVLADE